MLRYRPLIIAMAIALSPAVLAANTPAKAASTPAAAAAPAAAVKFDASNPFFAPSTLQYQTPDFSKIKDTDYEPAMEAGMAQQIKEIQGIVDNKEAPTFANTIDAMERTGALLTRSTKVFFALTGSNTNDTLQKAQNEIAPKLAAHGDAIFMDAKLFARVKAVYDAREKLSLDPESNRLTERYYRGFVRSGAELNEADKAKLRALNQEEAKLSTKFAENLLKETNDSAVIVDRKADLDGLSDAEIAAAAAAAKAKKLDGKYLIALQNTTGQPVLTNLKNRALREKIYKASIARGNRGNAADNKALIARMAEVRADRAKLLGFKDYAAYTLDDQMAHTPQAVTKLLGELAPAAVTNAKAEAAKMQAIIDSEKGGFQLAPWDWAYYAEKVRRAEFDLDESQVKPYLELDRVLNDGVFFAAHELYGLTFKPRHDIPVYQPDVRAFEVFDTDGKSLALYMYDPYARESKRGGAWEDTFVDQSGLLAQKPVVFNVTNFTKPAAGEKSLLTWDEANTLFHEFGHSLHAMMSNVRYPLLAGTATPRDFVEFPSQFNENWMFEPKVFANFAKHYQTGEPMPAALVEKIKNSQKFNQGFATTEYLAAALLDMEWHEIAPGTPKQDVTKFEQAALKKYGLDYAPVSPRYRTTYFAHVWGGGYAAGYYAYLWSEILDADAFDWFAHHGGLTRENGKRFRDMVLSRGGTDEAMNLYTHFSGHEPSVEPLLERRGLNKAAGAQKAAAGKP